MTVPLTNPLHLYRALLRETTYLSDQNARKWTQKHVKTTFRSKAPKIHHGKTWEVLPYDPKTLPSLSERLQLKRGRKFLVLLQRANQGYQRQLRCVLQLAYGRKGGVKRVLTTPLIKDSLQPSTLTGSVVECMGFPQQIAQEKPAKFSRRWRPSDDFLSLLHAQNQLSSYLSIRKQIKLKPNINEKNKWGRPMPPSRIKNTTKKWYAKMAGALMPPIPEKDWEEIKAIALRSREVKLIPRRHTASSTLLSQSIVSVDKAANAIASGIGQSTSRMTSKSIKNPHRMTARFVSRFYARHILNHTPVAIANSSSNGFVTKWDNGKRNVLPPAKLQNATQIDILFG